MNRGAWRIVQKNRLSPLMDNRRDQRRSAPRHQNELSKKHRRADRLNVTHERLNKSIAF